MLDRTIWQGLSEHTSLSLSFTKSLIASAVPPGPVRSLTGVEQSCSVNRAATQPLTSLVAAGECISVSGSAGGIFAFAYQVMNDMEKAGFCVILK